MGDPALGGRRSALEKLCVLAAAVLVLALGMRVTGVSSLTQPLQAQRALVDFRRQVEPIVAKKCLECHSQDKRKGGLSLATYADALEGGRNGAVIRPGNSTNSLMVHRLTGEVEPQMPKDEEPLSDSEIALIRSWIDQGARETPGSRPAPQPWEAPLALTRPAVPEIVWPNWSGSLDRFVAEYRSAKRLPEPAAVSDTQFARRVYLDVWGLLPSPDELDAFVIDRSPGKRRALVTRLLEDNEKYAAHWISFWNDLLRNEDGVTYFSETAGRKSITDWLLSALQSNLPYDQFVTKLLSPGGSSDPDGFLVGVNWRGETSAAVTPWMQASQNSAQIFLGINLKCNACHDSFVSKWKLKDAYSLAAYFSPDSRLQMFRCDVALDRYAEPGFLFPELTRTPASSSVADRRAAAAATFTDPRMGRLPRTVVNRIWHRLFGRGIVANPDEMDGLPWSPELLDWIASDFVEHRYDIKQLIWTILTSRAYQMPAVARTGEPPARGYVFAGPEVRRMTAEQFADALGSITGEWNVSATGGGSGGRGAPGAPAPSMPATSGRYAREWRVPSSDLTRALGRPIRDQVISTRPTHASTLQALELANGEMLVRWLSRGARRMLGELPAEPLSLYNRTVAGRTAAPSAFDIDVSKSARLWLIVQENGSNVPEALEPAWAQPEFVQPDGAVTTLSSLKPSDGGTAALRTGSGPIRVPGTNGEGVRVTNPSVVIYDIAGKGFTRFRGTIGLENRVTDIGATLNPQLRFFVFDTAPNMDRLLPPSPGSPLPAGATIATIPEAIDRVFRHALGRPPSAAERRLAEEALRDPARGTKPSPEGLADLLWAVVMKPEFQLIY
jgi:mono/diheme cytochrome c family protein